MPGREGGNGTAGAASKRPLGHKGSTKGSLEELVQLLIAYTKQETLDPVVKQLKSLAKGIGGAALLAVGTLLLAVGFVRALETEFGSGSAAAPTGASAYGTGAHLSGDLSWVPYMGGALFAVVVAGVSVAMFLKGGQSK